MAKEKKPDSMSGKIGNIDYGIHIVGKDSLQICFETRTDKFKIDFVNPIATRFELHLRDIQEIKNFGNGLYKAVQILISYNKKAEAIGKALDGGQNVNTNSGT